MKLVFSVILYCALTTSLFAATFNAGFVEGLWFSSENVFVDNPVRVYVAIRNNTDADLTGTVEFFVDGERIERNSVSALDGRIIESWADWNPTYGEHTISATLSRIELHQVGGSNQAVEVVSAEAKRTIFVDYDTDGDGQGNETDTDDDGDGVPDEVEETEGTDPLDATDPPLEDVENVADEQTEESTDADNETDSAISRNSGNTSENDSEGLEQFLDNSRANAALSSVTGVVNSSKKKLDEYRAARNNDLAAQTETVTNADNASDDAAGSRSDPAASSTSPTSSSQQSSFGEVTRTQNEKSPGFIASTISVIKSVLSNIYTLALFLVSLYLSHPILVQLTLLLLILFILYKTAKRLGSRER